MSQPHDAALAQRLRAAGAALLDDALPPIDADPWRDAARVLDLLVGAVHSRLAADRMWLLLIAVSTAYPEPGEVREAVRQFELLPADEAGSWLMRYCLELARRAGSPYRTMQVVTAGVVVDVNYTARHNLHTGIQRVVRTTLPRWRRDHDVVAAAWTTCGGTMRTLMPPEQQRVYAWNGPIDTSELDSSPEREQDWTLIVPWRSVVVLAEVPLLKCCARIAAMAELSGNEVVAIGYDCIPVVSADLVPREADRFVRYLGAIRTARRVAGISVTATTEFQGFAQMLPNQGLPGPRVVECPLPIEMIATGAAPAASGDEPLVLTVGSFEPRKNQPALLYAAEVLWREGHRFRLLLVGGGGDSAHVRLRVRALKARGRHVSIVVGMSDDELAAAYRRARFTVFTSLHEGYGLPAAESISLGTPVITSDYGSTLEVAEGGGAVLVDPRDDAALVRAMRDLLTDDDQLARLRAEILQRPTRTWDDYAADLWERLVLGRVDAGEVPVGAGASR
jgi:glycosyltransferase involved in cell wall biosynthesis